MADETRKLASEAGMTAADLAGVDPTDLMRLQALANRYNQSVEQMAEAIRKAAAARAGIIDRMR